MTTEFLERVLTAQAKSDERMVEHEEKRMKMEEQQMEREAQQREGRQRVPNANYEDDDDGSWYMHHFPPQSNLGHPSSMDTSS